MVTWLEHMSWGRIILLGVACAALFELATILSRFGLRLRAAQQTSWLGRYTFGLRIHHGYLGVLALLLAFLPLGSLPLRLSVVAGLALALSDLVHHAVVLPVTVGATEFDLLYPR